MKDNRHLYHAGIVEPSNRLGERNINYLNANPLKKLEALTRGNAIDAQQEFVKAIKNPASLQQKIGESDDN